ncbi:type VII secretion protein EssA [Virgibacillus dakarensis]|uniref:type VII secretion protein EssA n=1 Tax=Virgibacillus dakarensis TaxID=1917889 RepID=UPI001F2FFEA4|nr:type VII secretion protein EssA [Virgibacillus dakarensis]
MLQKLIKLVSTGIFCLLLMLPFQASAADSPKKNGELEWKLDRIIQNESGDNRRNTATELEKTFPDLFKEETTSVIEEKQVESTESIEKLGESLFTMESEGNTTIKKLENALFTSEYTAPTTSSEKAQEEQESSWLNNALVAGLTGLVCVVFGGIYIMMRKLSD